MLRLGVCILCVGLVSCRSFFHTEDRLVGTETRDAPKEGAAAPFFVINDYSRTDTVSAPRFAARRQYNEFAPSVKERDGDVVSEAGDAKSCLHGMWGKGGDCECNPGWQGGACDEPIREVKVMKPPPPASSKFREGEDCDKDDNVSTHAQHLLRDVSISL
jgi:hypothetical protein